MGANTGNNIAVVARFDVISVVKFTLATSINMIITRLTVKAHFNNVYFLLHLGSLMR